MNGGSFVERERQSSIAAVEDMASTVDAIFRKACDHDGVDPRAAFVVFSAGNPYVPFLDRAISQYREMASGCAAHVYVGLSMRSKGLYQRKRKAAKR